MEISKKKLIMKTIKTFFSDSSFSLFVMILFVSLIIRYETKRSIFIYACIGVSYTVALVSMGIIAYKTAKYKILNDYYTDKLNSIMKRISFLQHEIEEEQYVRSGSIFIPIERLNFRGCNCVYWDECSKKYQITILTKRIACHDCKVFNYKKELELISKEGLELDKKKSEFLVKNWRYI